MFICFQIYPIGINNYSIVYTFLGHPTYAVILNCLRIYCILFCFIIHFPSLHWGTYFKRQNCILYIGIFIYRILGCAVVLCYSDFEQPQELCGACSVFKCSVSSGRPCCLSSWKALVSWSLAQTWGSGTRGFFFPVLQLSALILPGSWVVGVELEMRPLRADLIDYISRLAASLLRETQAEPGTRWDAGSPPFISCSTPCSGSCLPVSELCPHM